MGRLFVGAFALLLSVALPATFGGPRFLVVLWVLIGLAGVGVIATSNPVQDRLPQSLRRDELKLKQVDEFLTVYDRDTYIAAFGIEIRNTTKRRKSLHDWGFASTFHLQPTEEIPKLLRAVDQKRAEFGPLPQRVEARRSVVAWFVTQLKRPAEGGRPGYELVVLDEANDTYGVVVKPRLGRHRTLGEALWRKELS